MKLLITGGSGFIGTNLIYEAIKTGYTVLNLDIKPPKDKDLLNLWEKVDILDHEVLEKMFTSFCPDYVIHLAARTDCDETVTLEDGYKININGTKNLLDAINNTPSVNRIIITSTQFVYKSSVDIPQNDMDYKPHTIYGQSKIITEQLTRSSNMNCIWTIVRPTTIWGPGDLIYRNQFYKILKKKLYFHPGNKPCYRSYGYVGNIVFQLLKILNTNPEKVNKKVIYLGDDLINVLDWVNEFHMQLYYRKAYIIPSMFIKLFAIFGDLISKISGKRFFIDSSRYHSMIESYPVPINPTYEILGKPPFTMKQGVEHTIVWLKQRDAL